MDPVAQLNSALSTRYEIERELGRGDMATVHQFLMLEKRHTSESRPKIVVVESWLDLLRRAER